MTRINSVEQFDLEIGGYSGTYCLLFSRIQSPPCLVMERLLSILCDKNNIKLLVIPVDNPDFFGLVEKYNVGILPGYLFIKQGEELYNDYGTQTAYSIEKVLSNLEV